MTKIALAFIGFLSLQVSSIIAVADTISLKKCIGALNAFENSIQNGESGVDSYWVRGTAGRLLMHSQAPRKTVDDLRNYVGNTKDISSCSTIGVSPEQIDLFVLAFHGYLPADPFEGLAKCLAIMLTATPEIERKLGSQRSQSLGYFIGERFGASISQLNYLYKSEKHTVKHRHEEVQTRATKISSSLYGMPADKRAIAVKSYLSKCAWYNIPLESVMEGAGVAIK